MSSVDKSVDNFLWIAGDKSVDNFLWIAGDKSVDKSVDKSWCKCKCK